MRAGTVICALGALGLLSGCGLAPSGSGSPGDPATAASVKSVPHNDIDLAVQDLTAVRDPARPGAWLVTFTIANLGGDVTPYRVVPGQGMAYTPIRWTVSADGEAWGGGAVAGLTGDDQAPCSIELDALPAGAVTLDVTVDPDHAIPDRKPGNNHATVTVTVGGAG